MSIADNIEKIRATLPPTVTLVNVSKFQPMEAIQEAYDCGERDFGESRVQELLIKYEALPKDIRWHFIGHLQTNKVKQIVPFVHLIQSVDSWHLLEVINTEAAKIGRVVNVLLEVHVAKEETKTGFDIDELAKLSTLELDGYSIRLADCALQGRELYTLNSKLNLDHVQICGLMAMATNTDDETEIRRCFKTAKSLLSKLSTLNYDIPILSIGMSDDYPLAIEEGSTMVRIGSRIFGERNK